MGKYIDFKMSIFYVNKVAIFESMFAPFTHTNTGLEIMAVCYACNLWKSVRFVKSYVYYAREIISYCLTLSNNTILSKSSCIWNTVSINNLYDRKAQK